MSSQEQLVKLETLQSSPGQISTATNSSDSSSSATIQPSSTTGFSSASLVYPTDPQPLTYNHELQEHNHK
jgi:hypothetical protein